MKRILHIVALVILLGTLGVWLGTGASRGWTKTSVSVMEVEPVTGIEFPVEKKQFILGVELLGLGVALSLGLFGVSFLFKSKPNQKKSYEKQIHSHPVHHLVAGRLHVRRAADL